MTSTQRFAGKTALITGAGSGIGRTVVQRLAAGGATIIGVDINAEGLAETSALLPQPLTPIVADVSNPDVCADVVAQTINTTGRLDILGNIAGISRAEHFTEVSVADYRQMMAVNVDGPFFMTQAAMPHLIDASGAVVFIASTAAIMGQAYCTTYSMSKAAVAQLTKSMALEFMKTGVRINAIAPGGIQSPMTTGFSVPPNMDMQLASRYHPIRGMGEPDEIAAVFELLASDDGRGIHGAIFSVDRGMTTG